MIAVEKPHKTLIFGHRGASGYYPENSLLAFEKALDLGADGVELDIHFSKDGQLMVFHDFELKRMTGQTGHIFEKTCEELAQLTLLGGRHHEGIPTLKAVLELMARKEAELGRPLWLNVELKAGSSHYPGIERAAAQLCLNYLPAERLIFSSFDHFALLAVKAVDPILQTGVLTTAAMVEPWVYVERLGADFYHPYSLTLRPEVLASYAQAGLRINPYTINDLALAKALKTAGVYGIITDIPDQVIGA